jgi:hypothetical protein
MLLLALIQYNLHDQSKLYQNIGLDSSVNNSNQISQSLSSSNEPNQCTLLKIKTTTSNNKGVGVDVKKDQNYFKIKN